MRTANVQVQERHSARGLLVCDENVRTRWQDLGKRFRRRPSVVAYESAPCNRYRIGDQHARVFNEHHSVHRSQRYAVGAERCRRDGDRATHGGDALDILLERTILEGRRRVQNERTEDSTCVFDRAVAAMDERPSDCHRGMLRRGNSNSSIVG